MTSIEVPYSIAAALPTLSVMDITNDVSQSVCTSGCQDGIAFVHPPHGLTLVRVQERETGFFEDLEVGAGAHRSERRAREGAPRRVAARPAHGAGARRGRRTLPRAIGSGSCCSPSTPSIAATGRLAVGGCAARGPPAGFQGSLLARRCSGSSPSSRAGAWRTGPDVGPQVGPVHYAHAELLPVPARGREGRRRADARGSCLAVREGAPPTRAHGSPSTRRSPGGAATARAGRALAAPVARLVRRHDVDLSRPRGCRCVAGRRTLDAARRRWLHTSALPVFAVLSVVVAVLWRAVAAGSRLRAARRATPSRRAQALRGRPPVRRCSTARTRSRPARLFGLVVRVPAAASPGVAAARPARDGRARAGGGTAMSADFVQTQRRRRRAERGAVAHAARAASCSRSARDVRSQASSGRCCSPGG